MMIEEKFAMVTASGYFKLAVPVEKDICFIVHLGGVSYEITKDKRRASWFTAEKAREVGKQMELPNHGTKGLLS